MDEWGFYLDDRWWFWLWDNFSITLLMIPGIAAAVLKMIAKINPQVPTDSILELIKVVFTRPGRGKENG